MSSAYNTRKQSYVQRIFFFPSSSTPPYVTCVIPPAHDPAKNGSRVTDYWRPLHQLLHCQRNNIKMSFFLKTLMLMRRQRRRRFSISATLPFSVVLNSCQMMLSYLRLTSTVNAQQTDPSSSMKSAHDVSSSSASSNCTCRSLQIGKYTTTSRPTNRDPLVILF